MLGLVKEGRQWLDSIGRCWVASIKPRSPALILDLLEPRLKQADQNEATAAAEVEMEGGTQIPDADGELIGSGAEVEEIHQDIKEISGHG